MAPGLEQALTDFVEGAGGIDALRAAARDEQETGLARDVLGLLDGHEGGDRTEDELRDAARGLIVGG